ncbi:MAG: type III pantothenate kinase [Puniceicoccales bacterium]|jgi:type III pantothenate kinase|nr:type III pantothenate kinase [Puniceicoccales bacterium]
MGNVFCVDIGNTSAHHGLLAKGEVLAGGHVPTARLADPKSGIPEVLRSLREDRGFAVDGISFCSVVPGATRAFAPLAESTGIPCHHLRHDACPGLGIHYPRPEEIGQDRLANCIGAQEVCGAPAVVLDMGTATTLDILTGKGYEGGIIAPGLAIMTRYLHEQTALLPALDPADLLVSTGIGKSTLEAMKLGCAVGFSGMIGALLDTVLTQLAAWGVAQPSILATGGTAGALPKSWASRIRWEPHLTLLGLEAVFWRAHRAKLPAGK